MASPTGSCSSLWILEKLMDIPNQPPGAVRPDEQYVLCFEDDGETLVVLKEPRNPFLHSSKEELSTSVATTPETYISVGSSQSASTTASFPKPRGYSDPVSFVSSPVDSQVSSFSAYTGRSSLQPTLNPSSSAHPSHSDLVQGDLTSAGTQRQRHHQYGSRVSPVIMEERKWGTLPLGESKKRQHQSKRKDHEPKRQSLPEIFNRLSQRLSFRRKKSKKNGLPPKATRTGDSHEEDKVVMLDNDQSNDSFTIPSGKVGSCSSPDACNGEVLNQSNCHPSLHVDSSTIPSGTIGRSVSRDDCNGEILNHAKRHPSVRVQHGAAARMSHWWLDQTSPHLPPKFDTLDRVPPLPPHDTDQNSKPSKQLKQRKHKRYSLPVFVPTPKTYPRPKSFHGGLAATTFSSSTCQPTKESSSNKQLDTCPVSRPVSWAAGQPDSSHVGGNSSTGTIEETHCGNDRMSTDPDGEGSMDTIEGTLCADSLVSTDPRVSHRGQQSGHSSSSSAGDTLDRAHVRNTEASPLLSDQLYLSPRDLSPAEEDVFNWSISEQGQPEVMQMDASYQAMSEEANNLGENSVNRQATSEEQRISSQSKAADATERWILPPQELCQKLERVQQDRGEGARRPTSDPTGYVSPPDGAGHEMKVPHWQKLHSSEKGGIESREMPSGSVSGSTSTDKMATTRQPSKETDIDASPLLTTRTTYPPVSNRIELRKQLEIADRITSGSEENNNGRRSKRTCLDETYSPRRRKASLVLALEDGQLDMDDMAVRSLDIESDINVMAQLNQLNQQLDKLNSSYNHLVFDISPSESPKPRTSKSHSIASTGSAGASLRLGLSSPYQLRRSGSESHVAWRHRVPLDIRPSSTLGRTSSGSKLTRQRSRDKIHSSSSPEDSPRNTLSGRSSPGECPVASSPKKRPKIKPFLRLQSEGELEDPERTTPTDIVVSPVSPRPSKPSSPTLVARLKNKLRSPKIPLKFPAKSHGTSGVEPTPEEEEVTLRKKSPGRKRDGVRLTWPFFPPRSSSADSGRKAEEDEQQVVEEGKQRTRKEGVIQLIEETNETLSVDNNESQDNGSTDSGMENDFNSKSNDDLLTQRIQEGSSESTIGTPNPKQVCTRRYPASAPMTPYRTPSSGSREDIVEGTTPPEFRSAENIIEGQEERPPKPKHRPKRRSRTDLPAELKAFLSELKENSSSDQGSEVLLRRKSLTPQRGPVSAYGKLGHASLEGTPEKSPTSPLMKLDQKRSCSFDALQQVDETDSTDGLPRSRSMTTLNEIASSLHPSSITRTLSLPTGLGDEVELLRCKTRYRKIHVRSRYRFSECFDHECVPVFAEAIWDHVSMDESELVFQVGDVLEITDTTDDNWWWGHIRDREGWLPAACVRLRVGQGETIEDCIERLSQKTVDKCGGTTALKPSKGNLRKISLNLLSNDQVRANVVQEILTTERDYVKLLQDICNGFICQARNRDDLFTRQQVSIIFGNLEDIYGFHQTFLSSLEECVNSDLPHLSQIGQCFLENREQFQLYSTYCNNYPLALAELRALYRKPRVSQFLEECRVQQEMIKISLDGFLLTPVQKICKYPLQLNELLKYTKSSQAGHAHLREAFVTMRETALEINEKKRQMENVQKIADWQRTIADWEGDDLLKKSSKLIHSGDVHRMTKASRLVLRRLFLFEHQLIICKKDLLRRNGFVFKGRIEMAEYTVTKLDDSKDVPASSWRLCNGIDESLSLTFTSRNDSEREGWMEALEEERRLVEHQQLTGHQPIHRSYTTPQLKSDEETTKLKMLTSLIGLGTKKDK